MGVFSAGKCPNDALIIWNTPNGFFVTFPGQDDYLTNVVSRCFFGCSGSAFSVSRIRSIKAFTRSGAFLIAARKSLTWDIRTSYRSFQIRASFLALDSLCFRSAMVSIWLTAPYSEGRRAKASQYAKQQNIANKQNKQPANQ